MWGSLGSALDGIASGATTRSSCTPERDSDLPELQGKPNIFRTRRRTRGFRARHAHPRGLGRPFGPVGRPGRRASGRSRRPSRFSLRDALETGDHGPRVPRAVRGSGAATSPTPRARTCSGSRARRRNSKTTSWNSSSRRSAARSEPGLTGKCPRRNTGGGAPRGGASKNDSPRRHDERLLPVDQSRRFSLSLRGLDLRADHRGHPGALGPFPRWRWR